jgi:hypothetical protein
MEKEERKTSLLPGQKIKSEMMFPKKYNRYKFNSGGETII